MSCCNEVLDLWDKLVAETNDPNATDQQINDAWDRYELEMERIAVAKNHPPGRPRRRP